MDPDSRSLFKNEVFPDVVMCGEYGSTMMIGVAGERAGLDSGSPCVFDPFSPYVTFSVVDSTTGEPVPYGQRGQVVVNHVSKSFLLPNNLERDLATRMPPVAGPSVTRLPTSRRSPPSRTRPSSRACTDDWRCPDRHPSAGAVR